MSWIDEALADVKLSTIDILFGKHAEKKIYTEHLDSNQIIKTIRSGNYIEEKSTKEKQRICFKRHFKENHTYFVVVEIYPDFLKVVTSWKIQGRV